MPFETRLVRFMEGEHRSPDYLRLNPQGKVPLLLVDGEPLSENVAILIYLARRFPEARLLPFRDAPFADSRVVSDLAWCASGLRPLIARLRLPQMFADAPGSEEGVRRLATRAFERERAAEAELEAQGLAFKPPGVR